VELPGLWKVWKAKGRLPPLATSPLEISPQPGEIPTFPQFRRRGRMGKWKTKSTFPTFPPPRTLAFITRTQHTGGLTPAAPRRRSARLNHDIYELGNILT